MANSNMEETFTRIYRSGWWGSSESVSGRGSELSATKIIREKLEHWLANNSGINNFFDAPCGDFNWMRVVKFPDGVNYIGSDIVADLINNNNNKYRSDKRKFLHLDVTHDSFPSADVWFCRDLMIHLPLPLCIAAIQNCRKAGYKYLLATTFINADNSQDIEPGNYRQINLTKEPFDLGMPLELLADPAENNQNDRYIGVWRL